MENFDDYTNDRLANLLDDAIEEMADRLKLDPRELVGKLYWEKSSVLSQSRNYKEKIRLHLNFYGIK